MARFIKYGTQKKKTKLLILLPEAAKNRFALISLITINSITSFSNDFSGKLFQEHMDIVSLMIAFCPINLVKLLISQANEDRIVHFIYNPFQPSVAFHIGTSHLFCSARQMTGFYMKRNTRLKWVNSYCEQYFFIVRGVFRTL